LTALADLEGSRNDSPYGPNNGGDFSSQETDPQVTIRFRPSDNHSLFFRYAEAFKAGGFDTGVTSIPGTIDDFRFEAESGQTYELGSKGNLWDGRARYDVTLFETTFDDFQVQEATGNVDDPFRAANAGQQQVSGVEFSLTAAATDNLTLLFSGALMDGEFTNYPNAACNLFESRNAETGPCRTAEEAEELGNPDLEDTIDRTGTPAPKTPDWKFVVGVDYQKPLANNFMVTLNAKAYASDGFITDASGFEEIVMMNKHEDINVTLGFGPEDGDWEVALYGRNLLEARVEYNAKFDLAPDGHEATQLSRSDFKSYGLKFRYNF
jgi:outer membrane receptor protein involved in Fe transport